MAKAKSAVPEGYYTVTPVLTFENAAAAIDWYQKGLGAEEISRTVGPDGRIMHAEIRIGGSRLMLHDAMGAAGRSPKAFGGSPISLWLFVEDCDALYNRAIAAGATAGTGPMGQLQDQFWGDRAGMVNDPHGYTWTIASRKEDLTPQEIDARMKTWMQQFAAAQA